MPGRGEIVSAFAAVSLKITGQADLKTQKMKVEVCMNLGEYFENSKGLGVLSTADASGRVDSAVYARPHVLNDTEVAFIMADRLTHANLQQNPHAAFLFKEDGPQYAGKRLYLTKIREEKDSPMIEQISRKNYPGIAGKYEGMTKFLVFFKINAVLPLIGDKE